MNVFDKLKDFMDKADGSFKGGSDVSSQNSPSNEIDLSIESSSEEILSIPQVDPQPKQPAKRGRKRKEPIEDLTHEQVLTSPLKSRRKIADELKDVLIEANIDLCNLDTPNTSTSIETSAQKRRGRKAKKPPKVSYKKALAVAKTHIPELSTISVPSVSTSETSIHSSKSQEETGNDDQNDDYRIDLTGDVDLKSYHSKAPIFSNSATKDHKKLSIGSDFDFNIDSITLNIKIKGKREKFHHTADQRFFEIFKIIAERFNVPVSDVLLFNEKDIRIMPEQTPEQVGHSITSIYSCRLMDESKEKVSKLNRIELKFQSDKWKKPIAMKNSRLEPLELWIKVLCEKEKLTFKPDQFTLVFDGDNIDIKESPLELDFEGGEILDCRIKA